MPARKLLLSIDPLAAMAETQTQLHERLLQMTPTPSPELEAAWHAAAPRLRLPNLLAEAELSHYEFAAQKRTAENLEDQHNHALAIGRAAGFESP